MNYTKANTTKFASIVICSIIGFNAYAQTTKTLLQVDEKAAESSKYNQTSPPQQAPTTVKKSVFGLDQNKDLQIAKWNGGSLTVAEVNKILERRRPKSMAGYPNVDIGQMDEKSQKAIVRELAYEIIMFDEAKKFGTLKDQEVKSKINEGRDKILAFAYFESVVEPEIVKLKEEISKEYYDKHKETEFKRPEVKVYQIIHAPASSVISVKENESPRDVTKRLFGSDKTVDSINIYPVPFYAKPNEIKLDDAALSAPLPLNTKVQFPPSEDEITTSANAIKKAINLLTSGETISDLATDKSYVLSPEFTEIDPSWITNYIEPLKTLGESTTISKEIKTPSGYDIIVNVKKIPSSYAAYDEVKEVCLENAIISDIQKKNKIEDIRNVHLKNLVAQAHLTTNNTLLETADIRDIQEKSPKEWVVKGEGFTYPLDLFVKDIRATGKDWSGLNSQERKDLAVSNSNVVRYLTVQAAMKRGLDSKQEFKDQLDSLEVIETVKEYLSHLRSEESTTNSVQAEIRDYYDKHLEKYTLPAQVTYREISKRINMADSPMNKSKQIDQAKTVLNEIRNRAKTSEQFSEIARKESESISTRIYGGLVGPVADNAKGNVFKNQIDVLKTGEISQPFLYGSEMVIIRLEERTAPTAQPFETVKNKVTRDYQIEVPPAKEKRREESTLEKKNFQLLF